jgi:hypothetical protein
MRRLPMPNSPCGDSVCVTVDVCPAELEKRNRLLGHALSHERRKVEAAIEYMTHGTNGFEHGICGLCPLGPNTDCRAITATDCKRLVHDYLDAKAKEGAK